MNKHEWIIHYRSIRLNRTKAVATQCQLIAVLHELYDFAYTDKQETFIRLVNRYKSKLGQEYLDKIESWKPEAKLKAQEYFKYLVYKDNPFLRMIPKDDLCGKYIPVPIIYGNKIDDE